MKFKCETGGAIPVGEYVGRFLGVALQDASSPAYKPVMGKDGKPLPPGAEWSWEIIGGPHAGQVADRLTGPTCTPKSECTQLAEVLTGKRWAEGGEFDVEPAVGTLWRFRVDPRENGSGTRVSLRGLARAYDLEKNGTPPPAEGTTAGGAGEPAVYVKLSGFPEPQVFSRVTLERAVKMMSVGLSNPAAFDGEKKWRTVGDVLQDFVTGRAPAAAAAG